MKKILALLLASLLLIGLFAGCAKQAPAPVQQEQTTTTEPAPAEQPAEQPTEQPENTELPTITFVHGYYHDESEWAAAAQMRQIYQDFADLHKDEFNFVAVADESGAEGMRDEWSGDLGVGCKYFSQDAVIKLAPVAGIALAESLTPAEKLKEVQKLAEQGVSYAQDIFKSIGVYLGHTLCLYAMFYDIRDLIVLGRVASGVGGELIVAECQRVLNEEYPELAQKLRVMLPDEEFRRVGQSMAAASLPEV